jgi:hypothetical protein
MTFACMLIQKPLAGIGERGVKHSLLGNRHAPAHPGNLFARGVTLCAKPRQNFSRESIEESPGDEVDRVFRMPVRQT